MREKNSQNMADPLRLTPANSAGHLLEVAYPLETRMDKGFSLETLNDCDKSSAYPPRPTIPESVPPAKAAELTGWGLTTIKRHCRDGKFKGAQKTQIDGNDSWQIPVASLTPEAQAKYWAEVKAAVVARAASIAPLPPAIQERSLSTAESGLMFDDYQRSGAVNKARAEAAHATLRMFHELVNQGYSKGDAEKAVTAAHKVSRATLHRYRAATDGHPVSEWLPRLAPKFSAGRPPVEFSEEAYAFIYGSYLNTSKTPLTVIMVRARALAKSKGWVIPSNDAVRARLAKEPRWALILGREGPKALEQSQPPVKRDYTGVAVNEIWCSDGHRLDLFTRWPDGTVERMFLIAWIDIRSRAILGVKVYSHPNAAGVLAAFGAAMQRTRTAPDLAKIDNGMEYAAKSVTGGQANRYRNKVVPGEPIGLLTHVGTTVHWSEPGRGQDKPIESFWNFLIDYFVKLPEFEGAYCGPDTASKPEGLNAAKHAVPIAVVEAKLEQALRYFNTEHEHRGNGMNKRTPKQVYEALVSPTPRNPVDAMYIEMCNHGAAQIKPDRSNVYALTIPGYGVYRYWSEELACLPAAVMGHKHNIYYDMDNPLKPVLVFDEKVLLGKADCLENIAFREIGGERSARHKREKIERMKPQKDAVKQLKARAMQMMTPLALPAASSEDTFSRMPVTFEAKRSPELLPAHELDDPWKTTGKPGELINQETGEVMRDKYAAAAAPVIQTTPITDDEEQRERALDELERQVREKKRLQRIQTYQSQD